MLDYYTPDMIGIKVDCEVLGELIKLVSFALMIVIITIIIIITEMIFMVLSSWQSHCESSRHSYDECRLSTEVATNPQTKPTDLDCESARKKWQLLSTSTIAI